MTPWRRGARAYRARSTTLPQHSVLLGDMGDGRVQLKLKHDVLSNMGQFELEGPMWEVGYKHAGPFLPLLCHRH